MNFSMPVFLFQFLPIVLALYYVLPHRGRNILLLLASLFFYVWGEKTYVWVLLVSIATNYGLGLWLDRLRDQRTAARLVLALAVAANLGLLGVFKYAGFFVDNLNLVFPQLGLAPLAPPSVYLPLGISFFTFHSLSYVIDVYRRETPALRNPVNFALYISFFPQSIAGPIVRYGDVASQLPQREVTIDGAADGVRRFILGLAKKMLIANTLAGPADAIFKLPADDLTPGLAWLGILCYSLQIYFDFSGYSDMAIGLAKMLGFQFRENFNYPYIAGSVTDFWRRWHISLSSWYRDYLYIPLGGSRCGTERVYLNLVTVFFLCGLWHGESWNFVLWGLFHGAFLVIERMGLARLLDRLWAPARHAYLLVVVMVGWVFFRAETLPAALAYLGAMIGLARGSGTAFYPSLYLTGEVALFLAAGVIGSIPVVPGLLRVRDLLTAPAPGRARFASAFDASFALLGVAGCAVLLVASAMQLAAGTYNPFIYFRF